MPPFLPLREAISSTSRGDFLHFVGAAVTTMHLGALHPWEQALTLVLAFGPFLVLGAVIVVRRRREGVEELEDPGTDQLER